VVLKDDTYSYHLLEIKRSDLEVLCFLPHSGIHSTLHESGESHIKLERGARKSPKELPVAMGLGEAGEFCGTGIKVESLHDLTSASCICTPIYSINSLREDFPKFNRSPEKCFVIDKGLLPVGSKSLLIQVWAVPSRNLISFEFHNPNIPKALLYKVAICEPQIWIFGQPF
jgi:hypothetical protein